MLGIPGLGVGNRKSGSIGHFELVKRQWSLGFRTRKWAATGAKWEGRTSKWAVPDLAENPNLKLPGSGPQTAHLIEKRKCTRNSSRWTPNCPALAQKAAWQRVGKGQRPATYCLRTQN